MNEEEKPIAATLMAEFQSLKDKFKAEDDEGDGGRKILTVLFTNFTTLLRPKIDVHHLMLFFPVHFWPISPRPLNFWCRLAVLLH